MGLSRTSLTATGSQPILSRPIDVIWMVWFFVHLLVMFCVDMVGIYPAWLPPRPLVALREWYIATYHDRFFVAPPAWFNLFIFMEALYHVPLSIWAIRALRDDHTLLPLHLLIWSVQTFVTTAVCVVDILYWPDITKEEVSGLLGLYLPYCALSIVMGADMFIRLKKRLLGPILQKYE